MLVRLPLALVLALAAGSASALDLARVTPGATLAELTALVAADGRRLVRLSETRGGERSTYLLAGERPAQFSFCRGRLSGFSEVLPDGITEFVARAEREVLTRGLPVPNLSLLPDGDEITYAEWTVPDGGRLTLAWTATAKGAMGAVFREWPCQMSAPLPVANLQPVAPSRATAAGAAARTDTARAEFPEPSQPLSVTAPDIVVALPETTSELAVNKLAALSGAAGSPGHATDATGGLGLVGTAPLPAGASEAGAGMAAPPDAGKGRVKTVLPPPKTAPVPVPPPRVAQPKAKPPAPAARALPTVTTGTPPRQAGGTQQPLVLFPDDPELDQTNTTAPPAAARSQRVVRIPTATPADGLDASLDEDTAVVPMPPVRPQAVERKQVAGRPKTPAECASSYRSYNPNTGTFRTESGVTKACP